MKSVCLPHASRPLYRRFFLGAAIGVAALTSLLRAQSLPSPWQTAVVGSPGASGSASHSSGTFTVAGAGDGIWWAADEFRYVYQPLAGDGTIIVRVATISDVAGETYEHAGIMIRETLNADSKFIGTYLTPTNGALLESRTATAGNAASVVAPITGVAAPYYLRLVRVGNTITASRSSNGSTWTTTGSQTITMTSNVFVGIAVCSEADATACTATFTNVSVVGPEINVTGNGANIADGDTTPVTTDHTDFGSVPTNGLPVVRTFTIQNTGSASLMVGAVALSGANAGDYTVTSQPAASVAAGSSTTFQVGFDPNVTGLRVAEIAFSNNDANENPYNFRIQGTGALPSPWQTQDIGAVGATGSASYDGATFTVNGSGAGIWTAADEFRFVHQALAGDASITARITGVSEVGAGWEHAGVMFRESTSANSKYFGVYLTPANGILCESRTATGGNAASVVSAVTGFAPPYWLRVERRGDVFTAFRSVDGTAWTSIGSQAIAMAATASVGLAVTSESDAVLTSATFTNVAASSGLPPPVVGPSQQIHVEDFNDGVAQNWLSAPAPSAGTWSVSSGAFGNASSTAPYQIAQYAPGSDGLYATDFIYRLSAKSLSTSAGRWVGAVFNYTNVNDYHYVLVDTNGSVQLNKVVAGVRGTPVTVANAYSGALSFNGSVNSTTWVELEIVRRGNHVSVRVNGALVLEDQSISATALAAGRVGVITHGTTGNQGQFDNLSITRVAAVDSAGWLAPVYSQTFTGASIPSDWTVPPSAGWTMHDGQHLKQTGGLGMTVAVCTDVAATQTTDYTVSATFWAAYSAAGNRMGLRFNRNTSAGTYGQVLISANGDVELTEMNGTVAVSTKTAQFRHNEQKARRWIEITVVRRGTLTDVSIDGQGVIKSWEQPTLTTGGIGLVADWQEVRFDNVRVINAPYRFKSTFPKLALIAVGTTTPISSTGDYDKVSKYDIALVGGGQNNAAWETAVEEIHLRNANTLIGGYTNVMEEKKASATSTADIWNKLNDEDGPQGNGGTWTPNDWWARNTAGERIGEYHTGPSGGPYSTDAAMSNPTFRVTADATGWRFPQWFANRNHGLSWSEVEWDFVFSDNVFYKYRGRNKPDTSPLVVGSFPVDWDRNGANDPLEASGSLADLLAAQAAAHNIEYRRGLATYLLKVEQLNPDKFTLGNVDGYPTGTPPVIGHLTNSEYRGLLSASLVETAIGSSTSAEHWAGWNRSMLNYRSQLQNTRDPHLVMYGIDVSGTVAGAPHSNLGTGYPVNAFQFARYGLATALLENGYAAPEVDYHVSNAPWFDEMSVRLGQAEELPPTAPRWPGVSPDTSGIYFRSFQNGVVLCSPRKYTTTPTGTPQNRAAQEVVFPLGEPIYRRINASNPPYAGQNTTVNSGALLLTKPTGEQYLTLEAGDGIILLKEQN